MSCRALSSWIFAITCLQGVVFGEPVVVSLRDKQEVSKDIVSIGDVAQVTGGDVFLRNKIAELDIAKLTATTPRVSVGKRHVQLRILLTGILDKRFKVVGANQTSLVRVADQTPEQKILRFLRPEVARRLGLNELDVQLRLARPIPATFYRYFLANAKLEHALDRQPVRVGPLTTRIGIRDRDQLVKSIPVSLEIRTYETVATTKRTIAAGDAITASDVLMERRLVANRHRYPVLTEVIGKRPRRDLPAGSTISESDLNGPSRAKREIVVRSRDVVELVARGSALQAKVSGAIAMQQGAIGDKIRVKNPRSGKVVTATVISSSVVEIRL